jgi:transcriptional regulator with XRE-family HTH domain
MKTFGQVIRQARKAGGLTQKAVAERLRRGDGRKVLPPFLNDLEFDRRLPPENAVIEQLAKILTLSPDILYSYAKRVPGDIAQNVDEERIKTAYRAFDEPAIPRCFAAAHGRGACADRSFEAGAVAARAGRVACPRIAINCILFDYGC